MDYPRVEYPTIVDKSGRHLVWNRSTHSYEEMAQDERSRETYKTAPEQWGFDPAETEIPGTPVQDFGKFGSAICPKCGSPATGLTCPQCQFPLDQPPQGHVDNQFADRVPKRNYLNQGDQGATSKVRRAAPVSDRQGGVLFQKSNDDLAFEAMTFGPRVAATLDDCPECGDVMVDRDGGKKCANCGHQQAIIQASIKEGMGGSPGQPAVDNPEGLNPYQGEPSSTDLLAGGVALAPLAIPLGMEAAGALTAGEAAAGAASTVASAPGRVRALLSGAKSLGKGALINQGINSYLGGGGGAGQGQVGDYEGMISHVHQSWEHDDYDFDDPQDEERFRRDRFADPGGNSALHPEGPGNPRDLSCPTCGRENALTPRDKAKGYQCDRCADAEEGVGY